MEGRSQPYVPIQLQRWTVRIPPSPPSRYVHNTAAFDSHSASSSSSSSSSPPPMDTALELTLSPGSEPPLEECVRALEEEEKTIMALEQELPLCKRLLSDAIEDLKKKKKKRKSEEKVEESCSGKRSSLRIFGKLVIMGDGDDEEIREEPGRGGNPREKVECRTNYQGNKWIIGNPEKKRAQFAQGEKELFPGSFFPFAAISEEKRPRFVLPNLTNSAGPAAGGGWASGSGSEPALLGAGHHLINRQSHPQPPKKARLCWTPELHCRFVSAIEQLGGDQAATPKRIRDLMKVGGITSDQVRSHLQKYRLSAQRAMDSSDTTTSNESGVLCSSECVELQRVRRLGYPQLPPDEMPIPSDAGESRQEEDENKSE